MHFQERQTHC